MLGVLPTHRRPYMITCEAVTLFFCTVRRAFLPAYFGKLYACVLFIQTV